MKAAEVEEEYEVSGGKEVAWGAIVDRIIVSSWMGYEIPARAHQRVNEPGSTWCTLHTIA